MILNQLPKSSLMVAGFLILATCSTMITFKQARAVDALGDVAALFGLSIISIFQRSDENERVRSIALIVIGGMVLTFIAARFAYLMIGGASAGAGSL